MKKASMNIVRFNKEDVIATSDGNGFATCFTLTGFGDGNYANGTITFDNATGTVKVGDYASESPFSGIFRSNFDVGSAVINGVKCQGIESGISLPELWSNEMYGGSSFNTSGLSTTYTWDSASGFFIGENLS